MGRQIPIERPQPSQLYIDATKLREALGWFDVDDPRYEPLPVIDIGGESVLSDGHTRAFLAYLSGETELRVVEDPDRKELPLDLYRECVGWCREEDLTTIADLAGRIVSQQTFTDRWISRCHSSPHYPRPD